MILIPVNSKNLQYQLDSLRDEYDRQATKLTMMARDKYVIPFCKKHNLAFSTGMGSWHFEGTDGRIKYGGMSGNGEQIDLHSIYHDTTLPDYLPDDVVTVLKAELHTSSNDVGSLMLDYTPPKFKRVR